MPDDVVVDTGPLIALALLGYLGVLRTLYGRVLVPEAVWREVHVSGGVRPGAAEIASASWIEVVHVPVLEPLIKRVLGGRSACVTTNNPRRADMPTTTKRSSRTE